MQTACGFAQHKKVGMKRSIPVERPNLASPLQVGARHNLSFRSLGASDFVAWQALRDGVIASLSHPDLYVREDDEAHFFALHSQPQGHCIGAFADHRLVAYAMLRVPSPSESASLAQLAQLPPSLWSHSAHLASCMVHPDWRGDHLQVLLLRTRMALALAWGRPICLAMVSLHNHASRRNLMRQGLAVVWTGWIDGLQRHIMAVNLQAAWAERPTAAAAAVSVPADDFEQMSRLTQQGYVGLQEVRWPQGCGLRFMPATMG